MAFVAQRRVQQARPDRRERARGARPHRGVAGDGLRTEDPVQLEVRQLDLHHPVREEDRRLEERHPRLAESLRAGRGLQEVLELLGLLVREDQRVVEDQVAAGRPVLDPVRPGGRQPARPALDLDEVHPAAGDNE